MGPSRPFRWWMQNINIGFFTHRHKERKRKGGQTDWMMVENLLAGVAE